MEALNYPYCTLEDVWRETRNPAPEHTDKYVQCINMASRFVEDHCRRDFRYHVYEEEEFYRASRQAVFEDRIYLPFPIITLTGLWVHTHSDAPADGNKWEGQSYYWEQHPHSSVAKIASTGEKFGDYPFKGAVSVQGTFGYAVEDATKVAATLPASIRKATALIAATMSMERRLEQTNLEWNRIELIELALPPEVYRYLGRYRSYTYMI